MWILSGFSCGRQLKDMASLGLCFLCVEWIEGHTPGGVLCEYHSIYGLLTGCFWIYLAPVLGGRRYLATRWAGINSILLITFFDTPMRELLQCVYVCSRPLVTTLVHTL